MALQDLVSNGQAVLLLVLLYCLYGAWLALYRLYLSPISRFPGPKLAALTWWYEFYYDAICGGKYIWEVDKMHRRYGPVVRINPEELHVADPDFYATLYSQQKRRNKTSLYSTQFGTSEAGIGTIDHSLHRIRRAVLNPFFSKASVNQLEPVIQEKVDLMVARMKEFRVLGQPIPLVVMFSAFTNDVVMEYSFARCDNRLRHPEFDPVFHNAMVGAGSCSHWTKHMNWILTVAQLIPLWLAKRLDEGMAMFVSTQVELTRQILDICSGENKNYDRVSHKTIFHDILDSSLPHSEKHPRRLSQEAQVLIGAGTETTAWAFTIAMVHVLSTTSIRQKLEAELLSSFRDLDQTPKLTELEQLPYLTACIQESIRLSYGVTSRLARIAPDEILRVSNCDLDIPPGTPVSMTTVLVHRDPNIFPNPEEFRPERWISNPRLDRYLVAFSKGTRQCLGINLAYAELYMGLGAIFRHFADVAANESRLVLYDCSTADVEIVADMFVPKVRNGAGVKAIFEKL